MRHGTWYILAAMLALTQGFVLGLKSPESLMGFTAVVTAAIGFLTFGGVMKSRADAQNGGKNGTNSGTVGGPPGPANPVP